MSDLLTLAEMQQLPPSKLREIALTTDNRFYSLACDAMANAMDAYAQAGHKVTKTMVDHVNAAKREYPRARETEETQVKRVSAKRALLRTEAAR